MRKGRDHVGLGRKQHGKREEKGDKRYVQTGCWSLLQSVLSSH